MFIPILRYFSKSDFKTRILIFKKRMDSFLNNKLRESWSYVPTDLSDYFIVKKFRHGWLMQKQNSDKTAFIPKETLIRMGYVQEEKMSTPSRNSLEYPEIIVVPMGNGHQRSKSCSEDENQISMADTDWRRGDPVKQSEPIPILRKSTNEDDLSVLLSRSYPTDDNIQVDKSFMERLKSSQDDPLDPL